MKDVQYDPNSPFYEGCIRVDREITRRWIEKRKEMCGTKNENIDNICKVGKEQ